MPFTAYAIIAAASIQSYNKIEKPEATLKGPTESELEKYPALKSQWDEWLTVYKITTGK